MRGVRLTGSLHLREAADEAGFVAQGGTGVAIGGAALPIREDDDARAQPAKHRGYLEAVLGGVLNVFAGRVEWRPGSAVREAWRCRGPRGTSVRRAAGGGLSR